jgi:hypothetical protein
MPEAITFDIPISVLIKGSRGIGKFATAMQVARRLGMHVFEVGIRSLCGCDFYMCSCLLGELLRFSRRERHENRRLTPCSLRTSYFMFAVRTCDATSGGVCADYAARRTWKG